jgi:hypothetical protein
VLYVLIQVLAASSVSPANDTYRYAKLTLQLLGESPSAAQSKALRAYCEDDATWQAQRRSVDPVTTGTPFSKSTAIKKCVSKSATTGLAPNNPRYEEIFSSRWGFPVMAAPFARLFGVNLGLRVTSWLMTVLGGLFIYLILRILGIRGRTAAMGQAVYYASPIGWWGSYGLTDGPAVALTAAGLLGALLILRRRYAAGAVILAVALAGGCFVRYSNFLLVGLALTAASLLLVIFHRPVRTAAAILFGLSSLAVAGLVVTAKAFHWSGVTETLQDTFTNHFANPDVIDPWTRFTHLNIAYWSQWSQLQLRSPWLLAAVIVGSIALLRRNGPFGLLAVAVAATGFLGEAAHPVVSQGDRLMITVWIVAALGLPLLFATRDTSPTTDSPTAPSWQTSDQWQSSADVDGRRDLTAPRIPRPRAERLEAELHAEPDAGLNETNLDLDPLAHPPSNAG